MSGFSVVRHVYPVTRENRQVERYLYSFAVCYAKANQSKYRME